MSDENEVLEDLVYECMSKHMQIGDIICDSESMCDEIARMIRDREAKLIEALESVQFSIDLSTEIDPSTQERLLKEIALALGYVKE